LAAEGWEKLSETQMQFKGTGGAIAIESNGFNRKIIERLAKSNAKAIAYS